MAKKISPLSVVVKTVAVIEQGRVTNKVKTTITVHLMGQPVASKTDGNRWTQSQAMKEWQINRRLFKIVDLDDAMRAAEPVILHDGLGCGDALLAAEWVITQADKAMAS